MSVSAVVRIRLALRGMAQHYRNCAAAANAGCVTPPRVKSTGLPRAGRMRLAGAGGVRHLRTPCKPLPNPPTTRSAGTAPPSCASAAAAHVAMAGDGQVTLGQTVIKGNARKVRRIGAGGAVLAGFAGATADAFTLLERLEAKLERFPNQLERACVELAKDWRTDRYLRRLEAMMAVADTRPQLHAHRQRRRAGAGGRRDRASARAATTRWPRRAR